MIVDILTKPLKKFESCISTANNRKLSWAITFDYVNNNNVFIQIIMRSPKQYFLIKVMNDLGFEIDGNKNSVWMKRLRKIMNILIKIIQVQKDIVDRDPGPDSILDYLDQASDYVNEFYKFLADEYGCSALGGGL